MSVIRQLLDAIVPLEKMAEKRGQRIALNGCSCHRRAHVLLQATDTLPEVLVCVQLNIKGDVTYSFPEQENEAKLRMLESELALCMSQ